MCVCVCVRAHTLVFILQFLMPEDNQCFANTIYMHKCLAFYVTRTPLISYKC